MNAVYALGDRLGAPGVGERAGRAIAALGGAGYLRKVYVNSSCQTSEVLPVVVSTGWLGRAALYAAARAHSLRAIHVVNCLFDEWVARKMGPCDLFHGWTLFSLRSFRRARELGAVTVLDRGMTHPLDFAQVWDEEQARSGLEGRFHKPRAERALRELERADHLLVLSEYARQTYLQRGYPPERIRVIPSGVDVERFRPREHTSGVSAGAAFRVLFVGRVALNKGVAYLLEAWRRLGWRDAELWLVGEVLPTTAAALGSLLAQPGVRLAGFVRDPVPCYQAADLFCMPSLAEGGARVNFEAMACGLPMVVTAESGPVGRDERELLLCPARDAAALARALERLRDDPALAARLGAAARQRATDYTWAHYGRRLVAAYRDFLPEASL